MKNSIEEMTQVVRNREGLRKSAEKLITDRNKIKNLVVNELNIDEVLEKYTEEEINKMTIKDMKEIFKDEAGKFVFNTDNASDDMIVDFIRYLKSSQETYKKIDDEMDNLDTAMKEFNDEIKEVMGNKSFNKMNLEMANKVLEDRETSLKQKAAASNIIRGLEYGHTLKPIFNVYNKISTSNVLRELKTPLRLKEVMTRYNKVCEGAGIKPELLKLGGFEVAMMDEKYHETPNLFIFIMMRYAVALGANTLKQPTEKTFMIQLTHYMKEMLCKDKSEEMNEQYEQDKENIDILMRNIIELENKFYK